MELFQMTHMFIQNKGRIHMDEPQLSLLDTY